MKKIKLKLLLIIQLITLTGFSQTYVKQEHPKPGDTVLHVVGYAHLDTQWRWDYPTILIRILKILFMIISGCLSFTLIIFLILVAPTAIK